MDEIFSTLAHPKRRMILLELFYEGEGTITHFKSDFKMKTGTLYHHLNILKKHGLVEQNDQKSYKLTSKGIEFIEPLFNESPGEFQQFKQNHVKTNYEETEVTEDKGELRSYNYSIFTQIDNILSYLFFHVRFVLIINTCFILATIILLNNLNLGLIGHHFINTNDRGISVLSVLLTLLTAFILLNFYPRIMNKEEPLTLEFFMLGTWLFIPIFISSFILFLLITLQFEQIITTGLISIIEFIVQIFWLFWVYIIFRRINGLDYLKSLLGSFIVNYIWLTLILVL